RHRAFQFYLKYPGLSKFLAHLPFFFYLFPRRIKKFFAAITDSHEETYLNFSSLKVIPPGLREDFLFFYPKGISPYKAALAFDQAYYLVNDVLKIHDNANMAHGLEGRAPFLDGPLVSLSNSMSE